MLLFEHIENVTIHKLEYVSAKAFLIILLLHGEPGGQGNTNNHPMWTQRH